MAIQKFRTLHAIDSLVKLEKYDLAQSKIMELMQEFPDDVDVTLSLATLLSEKGDLKSARPLVESVVGSSPDNSAALNLLAGIHFRQKRLRKAEEYYKQALLHSPEQSIYYGNLGLLYVEKKAYNNAIDIAEEGLKHDPEDTHCLHVIYKAYLGFDLEYKANPILKRILAIDPEDPHALLCLGYNHHHKGELDEASSLFKSVMAYRDEQDDALRGIKRTDIDRHAISKILDGKAKDKFIIIVTIVLGFLSGVASLSGNHPPIYIHEVFFLGIPQLGLLTVMAIPCTMGWLYITDKSKRHLFSSSELVNAFIIIATWLGANLILLVLIFLWWQELPYDRLWVVVALYGFLLSFFIGVRARLEREKMVLRWLSLLVILALMVGTFLPIDKNWLCFIGVFAMFFIDLKLIFWIGDV